MPTRRRLLALTAAACVLPPLAAVAAPPAPLSAEDQALVDKAVAYLQPFLEEEKRASGLAP